MAAANHPRSPKASSSRGAVTGQDARGTTSRPALPPVVNGVQLVALGADRLRRRLASELSLNVTEVNALGYLFTYASLTPSQLARNLGVGLAAVTAVLDHLENSSYARRAKNPQDRRSLLITLTPAGRHAAAWAYQELTTHVTAAIGTLPAGQIDDLAAGMTRIGRHLLETDTG